MSAYCKAGVTQHTYGKDVPALICAEKHGSFKVAVGDCYPSGLLMVVDPDDPESMIPFEGEGEVCGIVGETINTAHLECPVLQNVVIKGDFNFDGIIWPDVIADYPAKREIMNALQAKGICIQHSPC